MEEIRKPELSDRFDADDIRKIRDYNSQRHSQMSHAEVIADIKKGANEVVKPHTTKVACFRRLSLRISFPPFGPNSAYGSL